MIEVLTEDDIAPSLNWEPVAVINRTIEFFESQLDTKAIDDHDDLDYFRMLMLRSSDGFSFSLMRYRGSPIDRTTVFLPIAVEDEKAAIATILSDLKLEKSDMSWQVADWHERRPLMLRLLRNAGKPEPTT